MPKRTYVGRRDDRVEVVVQQALEQLLRRHVGAVHEEEDVAVFGRRVRQDEVADHRFGAAEQTADCEDSEEVTLYLLHMKREVDA